MRWDVACDNFVGLALVLLYLEDIKCLWGKCKVFLKKCPQRELGDIPEFLFGRILFVRESGKRAN
jgi:hypothetical protein